MKKQMPPSLRLILAITFGGIVLIVVTLLGLSTEWLAARQIRHDAEQALLALAVQMDDRLASGLFERYREIVLTANTSVPLRSAEQPLFKRRAILKAIQDSYPHYAWIGLADKTGRVLVAANTLQEGSDLSRQRWFQAGLENPYAADVAAEPAARNKPAVTSAAPHDLVEISAPVTNDEGALVGVLGARLSLAWAQEIEQALQPLDQNKQIEILIATRNGHVLLGPAPLAGAVLPASVMSVVTNTTTDKVLVTKWGDNLSYLTAMIPSQEGEISPGLDWVFVTRQPTSVAFASIDRLRWQLMGIGALFALLASLGVWLLAKRLTEQLQAITQAAEQVRAGAHNVTIPILTGNAEVASLSRSLNQLITDLTTAAVAERNRIARELHDSVTQTLFSSSMLADVLPQVWDANPELGRVKLEELRRAVRGALAEMRTLLLELRPAAVIDTEWTQLLRQLADAARGRAGVEVAWRIDGDCRLPPDVKLVFYRVAQEALNNVVKYAEAEQVQIFLCCRSSKATLVINDNGRGFDAQAIVGDHLGLQMMRERVDAIAGELHIQSELEQGTEVRVLWERPLQISVPRTA